MPNPLNPFRKGGSASLVQHAGDSITYSPYGPAGIDNRLFVSFAQEMPAPGFHLPKMPLIERITPKSFPAIATFNKHKATATSAAAAATRQAQISAQKVYNTAKMRRGL